MKYKLVVMLCALSFSLSAQNETLAQPAQTQQQEVSEDNSHSTIKKKRKKRGKLEDRSENKTGWNFGILPFGSYDNDLSLQLGVLSDIYYYGDGKIYPNYYHCIYLEASYYLRQSGIFTFNYNSNYLIPDHGFKLDLSYLPDAMSDFFGYNGYQSVLHSYDDGWLVNNEAEKHTRLFYKYKRNILRFMTDIDGEISGHWRWTAGIGLYWFNVGDVNLNFLNKFRKKGKEYPAVDGLVDKYMKWGLLDSRLSHGGVHPYLRGGIVYDSRDQVANPTRGIHADVFFTYNAAFGELAPWNNLIINYNFRHYLTIVPKYLSFAYRIGGQNVVAGNQPFYASSILNVLYQQRTMYEALGGGSSVRGMLRNRVIGKGFLFANIELRAILWRFDIGRQHFYLGLTPFFDFGMLTQPYQISPDMIVQNPETGTTSTLERRVADTGDNIDDYFNFDANIYRPHLSAGLGLKLAMNENFIISADWAVPIYKEDNYSRWDNFYINVGYLF
ncbi:MAG: BamA/TamA family outer membrane protein [Paludibacteraceae bacterium]|nr:BamA/TamA family outer membrane protein [Paludibacteraceae bacterium]